MAKTEIKTKQTEARAGDFLNSVGHQGRREDGFRLLDIFERITGEKPKMWGSSIIGFGKTTLKYASGREVDWMIVGFSPRKANLSLYLCCDIKQYEPLLKRLGKYKTGAGCLYFSRLSDIDEKALEKLIRTIYKQLAK